MKIFFPSNWMSRIVPFINTDNNFILVGSISQMGALTGSEDFSKIILYNWDHYDFIDMANRPDWVRFHHFCKKAKEVWIPTHAHASYFQRDIGVNPYVLNLACVLPEEWEGENQDGGYVLMSSRKDFYKRFDLFKEACESIHISFKTTHPEDTSREEYIKIMKNCRFYVQASIDESLGGLSLMEAVWNKKPVLMSDSIKGGQEIYGDSIEYFKSDSLLSFQDKLYKLWLNQSEQPNAFNKIKNQTPEGVAKLINQRICHLKSI